MYRVEILWRDQWYGLRHDSGDTVLFSEESVRKVCKEQEEYQSEAIGWRME